MQKLIQEGRADLQQQLDVKDKALNEMDIALNAMKAEKARITKWISEQGLELPRADQ